MNDWKITASALEEIVVAARRNLPIAERCALYAGLSTLLNDIEEYFDGKVDGYMSEKMLKLRWSVAANLGFDITNGHDEKSHTSWALGQLGTLRGLLSEKLGDQ